MITDSGANIPAGNVTGCSGGDGAAVVCPGDSKFLLIDGGAGDDSIRDRGSVPASIETRIEGGTGADELHGGEGGDLIEAGDDNDPDRLEGGGGDDALVGARTDKPRPDSKAARAN